LFPFLLESDRGFLCDGLFAPSLATCRRRFARRRLDGRQWREYREEGSPFS
jgi:hypothetical protein